MAEIDDSGDDDAVVIACIQELGKRHVPAVLHS